MKPLRGQLGGVVVAVVTTAFVAGCGRAAPPPIPTEVRRPDFIGRITSWAAEEDGRTRLTLQNEEGEVIDVRLRLQPDRERSLVATTNLTAERANRYLLEGGESGNGGLVLYGEDEKGVFYGATRGPGRNCFEINFDAQDGAYIEGDEVHLVSGLMLDNALGPLHRPDDWPLRYGDSLCLDSGGRVVDYEVFLPY